MGPSISKLASLRLREARLFEDWLELSIEVKNLGMSAWPEGAHASTMMVGVTTGEGSKKLDLLHQHLAPIAIGDSAKTILRVPWPDEPPVVSLLSRESGWFNSQEVEPLRVPLDTRFPGRLDASIDILDCFPGSREVRVLAHLRNQGNTTWVAGSAETKGRVRLGAYEQSGNTDSHLGSVAVAEPVAPGGSQVLLLALPASTRLDQVELSLVAEGICWFDDRGAVEINVPKHLIASAYEAQVRKAEAYTSFDRLKVKVTLTNVGDRRWVKARPGISFPVRIELRDSSSLNTERRYRFDLPHDVEPGASVSIAVELEDSTHEELYVDLVAERLGFFSEAEHAESVPARLQSKPPSRLRDVVNALKSSAYLIRDALLKFLERAYLGLYYVTHQLLARLRSPRFEEHDDDETSLEEPRPRVLVVSGLGLSPPKHGGAVRITNLIAEASDQAEIHLLHFSQDAVPGAIDQEWARECASITHFHWRPSDEPRWFEPPSVTLFSSARAGFTIRRLVEEKQIEVVCLEYTELGAFLDCCGSAGTVLVEHDLAFESLKRRLRTGLTEKYVGAASFGASQRDWLALFRHEMRSLRRADHVHFVSEIGQRSGVRLSGRKSEGSFVVPNGVNNSEFRPNGAKAQRSGVLLSGNFDNHNNCDAVDFFLEEVLPLLRTRVDELSVSIVGADIDASLKVRWDLVPEVNVIGRVESMVPCYHSHRVLVVPLRSGSGTRLKILEAFASQLPVVSTHLGAEGLPCQDEEHLLKANTPAELAEAVVRVLKEPALREKLVAGAEELAQTFDWTWNVKPWLSSIRSLASRSRRTPAKKPGHNSLLACPTEATAPKSGKPSTPADISVVIPTKCGGDLLLEVVDSVLGQQIDARVEILCVDSGSPESEIVQLNERGVKVLSIEPTSFNHGLTRDFGVQHATGELVALINQDALPADPLWLHKLTSQFEEPTIAAVQGSLSEMPADNRFGIRPFYWDSGGDRFYFTREAEYWKDNYPISFSTVNAAFRRSVLLENPFGWAPIMEDKAWEQRASEAHLRIVSEPSATVLHSHAYGLRSLWKRCSAEGEGNAWLGVPYSFLDCLSDASRLSIWDDARRGLFSGRCTRSAEVLFPLLRPVSLWLGHRRVPVANRRPV